MDLHLESDKVWTAIKRELFAVLGMVTGNGKARTVGIVYTVQDKKLYIATGKDTWKARHVLKNPDVSITIPITKRIPLLPWIKIPAATITFAGLGGILEPTSVREDVLHALLQGLETDTELLATMCIIEVEPVGDFITYGFGISLMTMRHPEKARGRVPVG